LGLPPIENNIVEGTVIKPLIPLFENNGSRIILKNKNDKFSEKTGKRPATVRPQIELTEEGEKYFNDLVEYLNDGGGDEDMKVNKIERDRKFWNEVVLVELRKYFGVLLKIIMNVDLMKEYMSLSENEQNEFIKKLIRGG
jgi:hypothetical protein